MRSKKRGKGKIGERGKGKKKAGGGGGRTEGGKKENLWEGHQNRKG